MKHLEAQPATKQASTRPAARKRSLTGMKAILAGVCLVGGIGYGMTAWWNPLPMDYVTDKEKGELLTQVGLVRSVSIEQAKGKDVDALLDSMHLDPSSRRALKSSLDAVPTGSGPPVLAEVVLWDFAAQDGDIVRVSSAGYEVDVPLLNGPSTVIVPVDASRSILLTGVRDGGGGITVGVRNGQGKTLLPLLTEGQVLSLPVNL